MICIDRCYCEQKTFQDLHELAIEQALDLAALARQEGCGTHCGWCIAYLRQTLITGQTVFHELLPKESIEQEVES